MKKVLASLLAVSLCSHSVFAQDDYIRQSSIGVSFILNDFTTPQRIRSGSLDQVMHNKKWAKFSDMGPGIGVTYFKGLHDHMDFAGTLGASFVNYPLPNKQAFASDGLLLEGDASVQFTLLSE